ncbi:MAG: hypothetical protein ACD_45C00006G0002 [uncultured bacterium]|nr:MAG: hypothetical protein ACD_45C00006G0002 [uncultured bacterium]
MPELPEVETTLRGIAPHIKQQTITNVIVRQHQLRWRIPSNIQQILTDEMIIHVERRGKYLLLKTHNGAIIIHLGMSGNLRVLAKTLPPDKHDHVDIIFHNKKILRFADPRRFGAFLWTEGNPHNHSLLKNLGVEPLTNHFSGKYLLSQAQGKTTPIKSFIMDSKIVTGIGNIYAAEALFEAGIYPESPAKSLSIERLNALTKTSKKILRHAIKRGGTTLKDFINSNGKPGYFSSQLKVYGRAGLPCVTCQAPLQLMHIGQRSTVYCAHCQT